MAASGTMTRPELAAILARIGWSHRELARRLGYSHPSSVTQWRVVPEPVAVYLRMIVSGRRGADPLLPKIQPARPKKPLSGKAGAETPETPLAAP